MRGTRDPVLQDWVCELSFMQQTVLMTAIRGPDGLPKYGPCKNLLRWFRRCTLLSALDGRVLKTPFEVGGGSFTGQSLPLANWPEYDWRSDMDRQADAYLRELDGIPHHFQMHFMHAAEIVGYKHPDEMTQGWWCNLYFRLVNDMHLHPETAEQLDRRLGDTMAGWLERADKATTA